MIPPTVAISLAVLLVVALFFVTRAGRPPGGARPDPNEDRRPAFSVEAAGLVVLLALLLAALWLAR